MDKLDDIRIERSKIGDQTLWNAMYRDAEVAVVAEFDPERAAICHRVFIQEHEKPQVILGTEPPPAVYKTPEAAGEAGLRRAMAYLDRPPNDPRTCGEF